MDALANTPSETCLICRLRIMSTSLNVHGSPFQDDVIHTPVPFLSVIYLTKITLPPFPQRCPAANGAHVVDRHGRGPERSRHVRARVSKCRALPLGTKAGGTIRTPATRPFLPPPPLSLVFFFSTFPSCSAPLLADPRSPGSERAHSPLPTCPKYDQRHGLRGAERGTLPFTTRAGILSALRMPQLTDQVINAPLWEMVGRQVGPHSCIGLFFLRGTLD